MKQFSIWQAPFYSFWSRSFYIDVAKNWHGLAYIYLFFLVCFTWLFMSIKMQIELSYYNDRVLYPFIEQMPTIQIEKGKLSIDHAVPYTVNTPSGLPIVTFDTREKPMQASEAPGDIFVTKDIIYCKGKSKDQTIDLSTIEHQTIDKKLAHQFVADFTKSFAFLAFLIFAPLGFIFCVLQTLVYALLGKLIARINKIEMPYSTLIRLSAITLTPVLLIDSIIKVRGIEIPAWGIIAAIISCGYLVFAINANVAKQEPGLPAENP